MPPPAVRVLPPYRDLARTFRRETEDESDPTATEELGGMDTAAASNGITTVG